MASQTEDESNIKLLTVEQLVSQLRASSKADSSLYCKELIRRFEPLLRWAWRRGAFTAEYQDFVQDVFLRLFRGLPHLLNPKAFPGYFRQVALSVAADHSRKQFATPTDSAGNIEEVVENFDEQILTRVFIRSYLEHLPPREREVIELDFLQELSVKEIGERLGFTPGGVRSIKSRALRRLRNLLTADAKALEKTGKND